MRVVFGMEACESTEPELIQMIPAQSRVNNIAGFAMDLTVYTDVMPASTGLTDTAIYLAMKAYTPLLEEEQIISLFSSFKNGGQYDSVICSKLWYGSELDAYFPFDIHDYTHSTDLYSDTTEGNHEE